MPWAGFGQEKHPQGVGYSHNPSHSWGRIQPAETTLPLWSIRGSELWEGVKKTVPENNPSLQEQGCTISLSLKNAIINYFSISAPPTFFLLTLSWAALQELCKIRHSILVCAVEQMGLWGSGK